MKKEIEENAKEIFTKKINDFKDKDLDETLNEASNITHKSRTHNIFKDYLNDIELFLTLLTDYYNKKYTNVPWRSIAAIGVALLYILSPVDFIPDLIPVIGYIDDIIILKFCIELVHTDIENYKAWKKLDTVGK